jgi:fumarylpyruvate hydrolase
LVVAIGSSGKDVPIAQANELIYGYGLGLDMTRRDLQISMRDIGRPWEIGKAFDNGAPLGQIYPRSTTGLIESGTIAVSVCGETRQNSNVTHLIWSIPEIISNLSTLFELQPGDIIYTGTPDGVGHVNAGEQLIGSMQGLADISITYG